MRLENLSYERFPQSLQMSFWLTIYILHMLNDNNIKRF